MRTVSLMIKPASGLCNMRCRYCFYRDITEMRQTSSFGIMSEATAEAVIRRAFEAAEREVGFAFQGGEPTMAGLDFFRRFCQLAEELNTSGLKISYAIQTNGLVLDESWAALFKRYGFLVGLSIDGTKELHDSFRPNSAGKGTYVRASRAAELLKRHGVEFNVLTVVTRQLAKHARAVYAQYIKNGWRYMQLIPCLEPYGSERGSAGYALLPDDYARFLKELFDCWYEELSGGGYVYIRFFENLMGMLVGVEPESCGQAGRCTEQMVVEADGGVYPCDFYVTDGWRIGSLLESGVEELRRSENAVRFLAESGSPAEPCLQCRWAALCRGGCRRDRDTLGAVGLNYYCSAYREFFEYAIERLLKLRKFYVQR